MSDSTSALALGEWYWINSSDDGGFEVWDSDSRVFSLDYNLFLLPKGPMGKWIEKQISMIGWDRVQKDIKPKVVPVRRRMLFSRLA